MMSWSVERLSTAVSGSLPQVDTAAGKWRDAGNGGGIIPDETSIFHPREDRNGEPPGRHPEAIESRSSISSTSLSDSYSASSSLQDNEDTHYAGFDAREENKGWVKRHVKGTTPGGVRKQILRKTVR
jgi:hypothetical protein